MASKLSEWWFWVLSPEEIPKATKISWSPIMIGVGIIFLLMRRLSPVEHLKHLFYYKRERQPFFPPAIFTDCCILIGISVIIIVSIWFSDWIKEYYSIVASIIAVWISLQTFQTSIFHLIWKVVMEKPAPAHSLVRNLILAMIGFIKIAYLFGLAYWWFFSNKFQPNCLSSIWDAIYFSFSTSTTLGFGDITPKVGPNNILLKSTIILELIISFFMFGVIVARSVSLIKQISDTDTCELIWDDSQTNDQKIAGCRCFVLIITALVVIAVVVYLLV